MAKTTRTISQEARDVLNGMTDAQRDAFVLEVLEVMATDPKEYGSLHDYRVETVEMLEDLTGQYKRLAGEQLDTWSRMEQQHARSDYRELTMERTA